MAPACSQDEVGAPGIPQVHGRPPLISPHLPSSPLISRYMADPERIDKMQQSIRDEVDCRLSKTPCEADYGVEECFTETLPDPPGVSWSSECLVE